MTVFPNFDL